MGFTVDAFVTNADEKRCRELAAGIAGAGYDGLVFAYGENGSGDFSWEVLKSIAEKGIPIVTFETALYRDGKTINGLTAAFQDDGDLTRLSLDVLLSYVRGNANRPVRVIRIGHDRGLPFVDRRSLAFAEYAQENAVEEAALVNVNDPENLHHAAWEALAAVLPRFPVGSVDALWSPYDAFIGGCVEALAALGRRDIAVVSIGISNDDIRLMQSHPEIWLASVAVDPRLAGVVNTRVLAAKLAGEVLPDTISLAPQLLKAANLNSAVNIANLSVMVPSWGDERGLFDHYQWMDDLKKATEKYLRIPPVAQ